MNILSFTSFVLLWKSICCQNYNLFYPNGSRFYGTLKPPKKTPLPTIFPDENNTYTSPP